MNIKKTGKPFIDMKSDVRLFDDVKHTAEFKKGYKKELGHEGSTAKALVYKRAAEVSNNRRKTEKSK